jgi:RimJ/RimL family protein N-acetyltransferase
MMDGTSQGRGNIDIRPFQLDDAEQVYQAVEESRGAVAPWMPDLGAVPSVEAVSAWITATMTARAEGHAFHFAIVDSPTDRFLGGCGLTHLHATHRFANLSYWVRSSQVRRGVATTATRLLAAWGFEHLNLHRIEIVVALANTASLRVAQKAGAYREGVLRNRIWVHDRSHNAVMLSLIPQDVP